MSVPTIVSVPESTRWHVVVRVGDADTFEPPCGRRDQLLPLVMDGTIPSTQVPGGIVAHNVWRCIDAHRLSPPDVAIDLFRAAAAVYSADARVLRRTAFDGWTREFVLHLPVTDPTAWSSVVHPLRALLEFLTGDRWELRIRAIPDAARTPSRAGRPPVDAKIWRKATPLYGEAVCLLSGGLDSFAGAVDELAKARRIVLVSHNTAGSERFTSRSQDDVICALKQEFGADAVRHLKFRVVPPPSGRRLPEDTQRSRSIMFLALGVLVASSLSMELQGGVVPLVVPENGFISLNVPLTPSRLGSCSTRTTHPYTMEGFKLVLAALNLPVPLELPYWRLTKGEMLAASRRPDVLSSHARLTNSCARPNDRNADPARPQPHCGYCVPCIIRRAALARVGLDSPRDYRIDLQAERALLDESAVRRSDVRAFELALADTAASGVGLANVLSAGPLSDESALLDEYVGVYRRGLDEVSRFLLDRPVFE